MGKLNTKIKFLIIAVYTLLLFLLVFVLFSPKAIDLYESYGRTPYDDHIGIMIKVTENRQSVLETYDSNSETDKKNKEGKNEKATYDVTISLIKLRVETLKNITVNLAVKTKDNGYQYATQKASKDNNGIFVRYIGSFNDLLTKEVLSENEGTSKKKMFDESPKEIYVEVKYTVQKSSSKDETESVLRYRVETLQTKESKYKKYEERQVLQETSTVARANWIDPTNDVFGLQIGKTNATGESKLGNIKKNLICFNCTSLNNNLAKYKLSLTETEIAEKNIKRLEQPNSEKLQLTPEISEIRMTVCGKIESKDKKFSNYVVLYSLYGFMSSIENRLIESTEKENKRITNYTTHLVENSLDESFNLSELYITMEGKLYNSTVKKVSSGYKISYNNLISIDDMYSQK
jgi:hypothetical protein